MIGLGIFLAGIIGYFIFTALYCGTGFCNPDDKRLPILHWLTIISAIMSMVGIILLCLKI